MRFIAGIIFFSITWIPSYATTWLVGPTRTYTFCSQVASLVQDGDSILIDAATYVNDPQVKWSKNNLYIAGAGGRPRLEAGSLIANDMSNGKGIFVISGANVHVDNIEFARAVVQDHNGAGIRQEGANLWVTHCLFSDDEMGILGGNIPNCKTTIEYSEFVGCGSPANPGYQHNLYINHIDTLVFRYNYSHNTIAEGHELKSRATYNFILYNRIANEDSGDSRTIDLPNGGTSVIVGNIIEQGPNSANSNILGYGLEGLTNPAPHALYCCSNTFINKKANGSFIQVANGMDTLLLKNNIFAGPKPAGLIIGTPAVLDSSNNEVNNSISAIGFVDASVYDYHLLSSSVAINAGTDIPKEVLGYALMPLLVYEDTSQVETRVVADALDIGAYEYELPLATSTIHFPSFSISPNPASGNFIIHLEEFQFGKARYHILNSGGIVKQAGNLHPGDNIVAISGWSSGIYFVTISVDNIIKTRKIIFL